MHIPDGYLSPETCGTFGVAMVPVWSTAGRRVHRVVKNRYVPLLAIGAAYAFLVMMLNVPIPDGTTAHAIGAVLIAVILGPWAAVIAVSIALAIQALFFGDGGVLAFGANAFNMAFVMTAVGYFLVYRPLTRRVSLTSPKRAVAAALGGYVGINASALCAATELGLQPTLFHGAHGQPLYAPYHLAQSVPAMMLAHLTVAGGVEFALTLGVVSYFQRANLPILAINHEAVPVGDGAATVVPPTRPRWRYALVPLAVLATIVPVGLVYNSGAFGEDNVRAGPGRFLARNHLSAVPAGLNRFANFWHHAIFSGYDFRHDRHPSVGYVASAFVGVAVISAAVLLLAAAVRGVSVHRSRARQPSAREAAGTVVPLGPVRPVLVSAAGTPARRPRRTPDWLVHNEIGLCPCGCIGRRRKGSFVEKTLTGAASLMRQAMSGGELATGPGLLQRLDARVKLVTTLALLVTAALVHHIPALVAMYVLTLVLAATSRVSLSFFVKRVWLFIPIFTGIVVLPATLSVVTKGHVVVPLGTWWFGHRVGVTREGLAAAGLIISRVAVSISLVVLLTLTTPWPKLLAGLRALLVPRMFIQVIGMSYRYIFLLVGSIEEMYTARRSRAVAPETDVGSGRAFVSASAGALFGKAHALSEEVHQAMVSRGYTGSVHSLDRARLRGAEWAWLGACVVTTAATLGVDRVVG